MPLPHWACFCVKLSLMNCHNCFNVLKGEMSLVGPRPCLLNQSELIFERQQLGVFAVLPGHYWFGSSQWY